MNDPKRRALGRGLDALLPAAREQAPARTATRASSRARSRSSSPQKGQPRQHFAKDKHRRARRSRSRSTASSSRSSCAASPGQDKFEIIAGERRWRASQKAGLREVLVVVKDVSPKAAFELALIENVQREDLNPVELAEALDRLVKEHDYTQETLAERLGKDRTTVANSLRLLKLPASVRVARHLGRAQRGPRARAARRARRREDRGARREGRARSPQRARRRGARPRREGEGGAGQEAARRRRASPRRCAISRTASRARPARRSSSATRATRARSSIPYEDLDHLDRILARVFKMGDDAHERSQGWPMSATILDGKKLAESVRAEVREGVAAFVEGARPRAGARGRPRRRGSREPGLHAQQGEGGDRGRHPRQAPRRCRPTTTEAELLALLDRLNADDTVDGILVQLPLPKQIREQKVLDAIRADKDVDGFHPVNAGLLASGRPALVPCTPRGCMKLIALAEREARGRARRRRRPLEHRRQADGAAAPRARTRR